MIAPFWADVDIRSADGTCSEAVGTTCTSCTPCQPYGADQVWWALEPGRAVVTWDEVGYYNCRTDRRMSFQLVLTEVTGGCGGGGDFDVEFRFNRCEWETGDASGGSLGSLPCPAAESPCIAEGGSRTVTFNSGNSGAATTSTSAALTVTVAYGSYSQAYRVETDTGLIYPFP